MYTIHFYNCLKYAMSICWVMIVCRVTAGLTNFNFLKNILNPITFFFSPRYTGLEILKRSNMDILPMFVTWFQGQLSYKTRPQVAKLSAQCMHKYYLNAPGLRPIEKSHSTWACTILRTLSTQVGTDCLYISCIFIHKCAAKYFQVESTWWQLDYHYH
jgi:hypothetical protein